MARLADRRLFATNSRFSDESFPADLRRAVADVGVSGVQQFTLGDEPYVGVGIHIAAFDANYYEAFQLSSNQRHAALDPARPA